VSEIAMKFLRRMLGFTLVGVIYFFAAPGHAENTPRLDRLEVALWPEYDRSAVLVIYKAYLDPATPLPTNLTLPIPTEVGEPHAVAIMSPDEDLVDADYIRSVDGEWATITLETDQSEVWVEFYDAYTQVNQERTYTFAWPGGHDIGAFSYEVQQPLGTENLQVTPAGDISQSSNGLTRHQADLGPLPAMADLTIDIRYSRVVEGIQESSPELEGVSALDSLQVSIWPEYDRPAVLVIYRALLRADEPLPARVSLPIPTSAGEPHAVAIQDSSGNLLSVDFERRVQGAWSTITVETGSPFIWVEYYSDLIVREEQRTFAFVWPGGMELNTFVYEVQQPIAANNFLVTPVGAALTKEDGAIYYQGSLFPRDAATDIAISLVYSNPSSNLSIDFMEAGSAVIRPEGTQGRTPSFTVWLPWTLGGLGAFLVLLGIIFYIRLNRGAVITRRKKRRQDAPQMPREGVSEDLDASTVFCHKCGARAAVNDRFCRKCGTRLRS
jgi:hypothetical protein